MLTHGVEIIKDLVHPDYLVIQFVVAVGIWQKGVTIGDEQIEDVNYLKVWKNFNCKSTELYVNKEKMILLNLLYKYVYNFPHENVYIFLYSTNIKFLNMVQ